MHKNMSIEIGLHVFNVSPCAISYNHCIKEFISVQNNLNYIYNCIGLRTMILEIYIYQE